MSGGGADTLVRGARAGAAAWWAMDQALQFVYDRQGDTVRRREAQARNGVPAMEVLAEVVAGSAGLALSERQRQAGGTMFQWVVGVGAGMIYAAVRQRLPGRGVARGLGYGAAFSLVVDEGITPLLGLSPGPRAFPWQTHARGFLGHLVFGIAVEMALETLQSASREPERPAGHA